MRQWALYRIECMTCGESEIKSEYIGKSARTLFDRGLEHLKAWKANNVEGPLVEHQQKCHEGKKQSGL